MGHSASRGACCSIRDKIGDGSVPMALGANPQFESLEADVLLDKPIFSSFAPVHQRQEVPFARRIALASRKEVHVYRLPDAELSSLAMPLQFPLCNRLHAGPGQVVTSIMFVDEDNSRQLAIAFSPEDQSVPSRLGNRVRIWNCEASPEKGPQRMTSREKATASTAEVPETVEWNANEGFSLELEVHPSPITKICASRTYLFTADTAGAVRVWQKNRNYERRSVAVLHPKGIADISADRLFVYSAGQDGRLCVWSLPGLGLVYSVPIDIPADILVNSLHSSDADAPSLPMPRRQISSSSSPASGKQGSPRGAGVGRIGELSLIRRPLSRWAGWQGSSRGPKVARGIIIVAGILSANCEVCPGSSVLMEWCLGESPACRSAQVAHETPIINMVYGPYDNGPLVTVDTRGVFRVWDMNLLDVGLRLSQQIELFAIPRGVITLCVEQPRGLYVAAQGGKLFCWQRCSELTATGAREDDHCGVNVIATPR